MPAKLLFSVRTEENSIVLMNDGDEEVVINFAVENVLPEVNVLPGYELVVRMEKK